MPSSLAGAKGRSGGAGDKSLDALDRETGTLKAAIMPGDRQHSSVGPPVPASTSVSAPTEHLKEAYNTLVLLVSCAAIWMVCSYIDATYTPRDFNYIPSRSLIISYQWCMVGYASNLILTLMK